MRSLSLRERGRVRGKAACNCQGLVALPGVELCFRPLIDFIGSSPARCFAEHFFPLTPPSPLGRGRIARCRAANRTRWVVRAARQSYAGRDVKASTKTGMRRCSGGGVLRARHRRGRGENSIGMARVVLENLSKTFVSATGREVRAVQRLNLVIEDKELLVLVGPSGCGKTTTLRLIAGLEELSAGTISLDGRVVNDVPPKERD